jgi:C_GCAxxG_C_C family probable redox protein
MDNAYQAKFLFKNGYSCSQAILIAFGSQFGLSHEMAARIAAPFGGGLARRGEICGALSGALMVIGLKFGNTSAEDKDSKEHAHQLSEVFLRRFESRHGTIACRDLIDWDISTPNGLQSARDSQLFSSICPKFVYDAADILTDLLSSSEANGGP